VLNVYIQDNVLLQHTKHAKSFIAKKLTN